MSLFKVKKEFKNSNMIHPFVQSDVFSILLFLKPLDIDRVIIFGSSTTRKCTPSSDIDIYIDSKDKNIRKKLLEHFYNLKLDIWTNELVDERLLKEITNTGVVVYEK